MTVPRCASFHYGRSTGATLGAATRTVQLEQFQQQHLARLAEEFSAGTCWRGVPVIFASARVAK